MSKRVSKLTIYILTEKKSVHCWGQQTICKLISKNMDTVNTGERKMLQSMAQSACFSFSCLLTHLLNMAELFKVQGSEISYTTVCGKETLSRIFRKHQSLICNLRTANHYILQHQAMQDVIFRFTP